MTKMLFLNKKWLPALLVVSLIYGGCLSVQPTMRDFMTENDFQLCLAQVTLDFLQSPWAEHAMKDGRKAGTLLLNPPLHNGVLRIRTGKGGKELRSFSVDGEFTRPMVHLLQDPVACQKFWASLRADYPTVWHDLCVQRGMDETTWQPPVLEKPLFAKTGYQPDASCTHSLTVTFSQDTNRVDANHSIEQFRFHVQLLEIESGHVEVMAMGTAQHEWKRKVW